MPLLDNLTPGDLAKSGTFPEGVYEARCNKCEFHEAKIDANKQTFPYVGLDMVVIGPAEAEEHLGRHVFENALTLKPGANWKLREVCAAFGIPEDEPLVDAPGTDEARFRTELFTERTCLIAVGVEKERTDKATGRSYPARNNVVKYMPLSDF